MGKQFKVAFVAVALSSTSVHASSFEPDECSKLEGAQSARCEILHSGASSIVDLRASGDNYLQVLLERNWSGIVIELRQGQSGEVSMALFSPFQPRPSYAHAVTVGDWADILRKLKSLPADIAKEKAELSKQEEENRKAGVGTVCLHPAFAHLETNAAGAPTSIEGNACDGVSKIEFAEFVAEKALANAPPCALLDTKGFYTPRIQLEACLMLSGNREVAAHALNSSLYLDRYNSDGDDRTLMDYIGVLSRDVHLKLAGKSPIKGAQPVAAWLQDFFKRRDGWIEKMSVTGSSDGAVVEGVVAYQTVGKMYAHDYKAHFEQIWRRGPDHTMRVTKWIIGRFERDDS